MLHGQMQSGNAPPGVVLPCLRSNGGVFLRDNKIRGQRPRIGERNLAKGA